VLFYAFPPEFGYRLLQACQYLPFAEQVFRANIP
jgi:hypothetical protein